MSQLTEARCMQHTHRFPSSGQPSQVWPRQPASLRSTAEGMLRELAFVYQATRTVRESIMASSRLELHQSGDHLHACC